MNSTSRIVVVALMAAVGAQAQNTWNGGAGDLKWSSPGNWSSYTAPGSGDYVLFDVAGAAGGQRVVNNIVDGNRTISSLGYDPLSSTNAWHTTLINPGVTLSIATPQGSPYAIAVGSWAANGAPLAGGNNDQVYASITGTNGALVVNSPYSTIRVEQPDGTSGSHWATLDMGGLGRFTASVSNLLVGADLALTRPNGTLILAQTNVINTKPTGTPYPTPDILLGTGGWDNSDGGAGNLYLGKVNSINAGWIAVGGFRGAAQGTSTLRFADGITNGTVTFRGSAGGTSRLPWLTVGDMDASDVSTNKWLTSRGSTGVAEFRGNTLDLMADSIALGRNPSNNETNNYNTGATGTGNGTLNFDTGIIDVNNLYIGYKVSTNYGRATGTLNASGGTLNVNNDITMTMDAWVNGNWQGTPSATLSLSSNAVANVKGSVIKGIPSRGTTTINLNSGAVLDLQPAGDTSAGDVTINDLNINAGRLANVNNLTVLGTLSLAQTMLTNGRSALSAGTINLNANSSILNISNITATGTINFLGGNITNGVNLTAATLTGNGSIVNFLNVTSTASLYPGGVASVGTLDIGGNLTVGSNAPMTFGLSADHAIGGGVNSYVKVAGDLTMLSSNSIAIVPMGTMTAGSYRLFDYSGNLSMGTALAFTNYTRYALSLDVATPHQINLVNGGGSASLLVWKGSTATGGGDWNLLKATNWDNLTQPFYQGDGVVFENNGVATNITATGLLYPESITVNDSRNYSLAGAGKISGLTGITKNGTGQLTINTTGGNDFNGNVVVNGGVLKISRADALGSTNGTTTIASGAMLDIAGTAAYTPGETVIISGNGTTNGGAIINTGADQNNALRFVKLAGDASIGNYPARWDIRGPGGSGTFNGGLFLNGFTYTKMGPGKQSLVDMTSSDAGNIVVAGGTLGVTRSILTGPGTITVQGTNILQLENYAVGAMSKPIVFTGNGVFQVVGNSFVLDSPITNKSPLAMVMDIQDTRTLTVLGGISGSGGITKISPGTLELQSADVCTGPLSINAGSVVVTGAGSLANASSITLATGTVLDVSATGGLAIGAGQGLAGSGLLRGNLSANAGSTLDVGAHPGSLTIAGNMASAGSTNYMELGGDPSIVGDGGNDLIAVQGNLTLSGVTTFVISPLADLNTFSPYTIMTYSGTLSGGAANIRVASSNPRYSFTVVDPATTPGTIQITVSGTPANLVWHGGAAGNPNVWNTASTLNWLNGATTEAFFSGDAVSFDDTAVTSSVSVPATVQPGSIQFNNGVNYTITGAGGITAGSLTKNGEGSLTLSNTGTNAFQLGLVNNAGLLTVTGTNFLAPGGLVVNGGTLAFNPSGDLTVAAAISDTSFGGGTVQKLGTNVLTLAGVNSNYNGLITVSAGTLRTSGAGALGSVNAPTTVASGATLDVNGRNLGMEQVSVGGAGVNGAGAIYNSGAGQNNALLDVTLTGDTTFGGTGRWDIRSQTIDGGLVAGILSTLGQPVNLTKVGSNQVSLVNVAVDAALANIDVQQGIFSVEANTFGGSGVLGDTTRTLTIRSNAVFQLWSLNNVVDKVVVMQDGAIIRNGSGDNSILGPITLNGSNVFDCVPNNTLTLGNVVSGSGSIYKTGGGSGNNPLALTAENTFTGGVYIDNGTLRLQNSLALGTSKAIMVKTTTGGGGTTGTRVNLRGIGASVIMPPGVSVNLPSEQPANLRSMLFHDGSYPCEWQGPINFYKQPTGETAGTVGIVANSSNVLFTVSGPMSGEVGNLSIRGDNFGVGLLTGRITVGNAQLEKTGNCLWTFSANNNVWGNTVLHQGTLQLGVHNGCPATTLMVIGEGTSLAILDLNGFNQQVSGLGSAGNNNAAGINTNDFVVNSSLTTDSTLTILGTNVMTYAGTIMDQAVAWSNTNNIGGSRVALTLASGNTGSLTLSGINAYTGPTLVNGGSLLVNGTLANTTVTVNSGGILGGIGTIQGPVAVNSGGTLAAGSTATGTLTVNNAVTLAAGSTTVAEYNGAAADKVVSTGTMTYGGTLVMTNIGATTLAAGAALKVFDAPAYNGSFTSIVPAQPAPGMQWDTSKLAVDGTIRVIGIEFQGVQMLAGGTTRLTVAGPVGSAYQCLATTDLSLPISQWQVISSGTITTSPFVIDDTTASSHSQRFYRFSLP